jgi:hypothetical protein
MGAMSGCMGGGSAHDGKACCEAKTFQRSNLPGHKHEAVCHSPAADKFVRLRTFPVS